MHSTPAPQPLSATDLQEQSRELILSLQDSLRRVRRASEAFALELEAEAECAPDVAGFRGQIAKVEGLVRDLQKLEKLFVQNAFDTAQTPGGAGVFDLTAARAEIERRLARLAESLGAEDGSE